MMLSVSMYSPYYVSMSTRKRKTNDARMCGDMEWGYVGFITITDIRIKTGTTIT